jgi:hypothetical protein
MQLASDLVCSYGRASYLSTSRLTVGRANQLRHGDDMNVVDEV